ncbi:MAG: glycosyltransferase, partial [Marinoscillum sp.]
AGLAQSTGRFVLFLDDDDWLEDGFVSGVLTEFDNETQVIIAKANLVNNGRPGFDSLNRYYNFLREKYHKLSVNDFGYFLIYCPAIHCLIWKRSCFDQIHFNESIRYGEDREILLRMKAAGITMRSLDHLGGNYRISAGRNAKDTSFIDVILNDQLVTTPGERAYLYWLKGYLLFSDGKYLKGISEMIRSFYVPKIFMQQLVLFFRFRLIR